jgi:hypothetical protein
MGRKNNTGPIVPVRIDTYKENKRLRRTSAIILGKSIQCSLPS